MRYLWVDYAKAIGIVLVVYGHVAKGLFNAGLPLNESTYRTVDSIIYSFHMPLFFFLSGLFFYESLIKRGWRGLFANKIDTIIYPYIIWSILQGSIEAVLSQWTNYHINFSNVLNLLWLPRAQFWFLYALFYVTLVATMIYSKTSRKYFLHIALAASIIYLLKDAFLASIPIENILRLSPIGYILDFFCFFAIGIYFNQIQNIFYRYSKIILPVSFAIFCVTQYFFHGGYDANYTTGVATSLAITIVSIILVISLCMRISSINIRLLSLLGAYSMVIYLVHILAGSGIRIILTKFLHINDIYTHIILGCLFGIFIPILLVKVSAKLHLTFLFSIPFKLSIEKMYNNSVNRIQ
jgi:fucose 4-O-acetylase-like acetyltransferase